MIIRPCAKINLGLNITSARTDGYHNIESVFYPIPLYDTMEIQPMGDGFPSAVPCDIKVTGNSLECNEQRNLVIRAYNLIAQDYKLPRLHIHLYKNIPSQAGLGGGSSDASYTIKFINEQFNLGITKNKMFEYAESIGADCPFFIDAKPAFATGIGNILAPITNNAFHLKLYYILIVKPDINVSTASAYKKIVPHKPERCCAEIIKQPIETWREELRNDFETPVFAQHPELFAIKNDLYFYGAVYAQMSGSGSTIYGLFADKPCNILNKFDGMFTFISKLGIQTI